MQICRCDSGKHLQMGRLSWTIHMGSKYDPLYPYKREFLSPRDGDVKITQRMKTLALKVRVMPPQAKECWQPLEVGRETGSL